MSSDMYELEKKSLEKPGLVGVAGISSDKSDAVVETLIGVLVLDAFARTGVIGRGVAGCRWNLPPSR